MADNTTRRRFLQLTGGATAVAVAGCSGSGETGDSDGTATGTDGSMGDGTTTNGTTDSGDGMGDTATTVTVRIENVAATDVYPTDASTGGQVWLTPGAYAVHTDANPIFSEGEAASVGLEAQAEAGPPTGFEGEPGLVEELDGTMGVVTAGAFTPADTVADPSDPVGEVPGAPPVAPGGAFEFEVEAAPDQRLSFATMFVPSNDLFLSPGTDGIALWDGDEPVAGDVTEAVDLWDAGTEPNQKPGFGSDQAPAQSGPNRGDDEGGVVRPVPAVDDGFDYPAVADIVRVTLTPDGTEGEMTEGGMNDDGMTDGDMDGEMATTEDSMGG